MIEWCIYIALYCVLLYTQSTLQSCVGGGGGVSPQPPPVCSIHLVTTHQLQVERRESHRANQVYVLTTHQLQVERRDIEPIKCIRSPHTNYRWRRERDIEPIKWIGIIRRPWLTKASGGNLARTPGLHPYSLREVPWDFFITTESQDLGLMSHPKDGASWQYSVPVTTLGH